MSTLSYWAVLFVASVRNIFTHKLKSAVVGLLMFFGTALVVIGTSLLDSMEDSMSKSITSSLAGHLQIYSSQAKDELALFGGMMMGREDIGRIANFEDVQKVAEAVDNVRAVVPMGIDIASITGGNETDRLADALRAAIAAGDQGQVSMLRGQLQQMAEAMQREFEAKRTISADQTALAEDLSHLDRLESQEFWDGLAQDPELGVQFIETKIAPMSSDGMIVYLRYVGTDLDAFTRNFERFEIVKGEAVPPGHRGFLFADKFYEDRVKHKVARDLDKVYRKVRDEGVKIADDPLLRNRVEQMWRQYRRISFQLRPEDATTIRAELRRRLPSVQADDGGEPTLEDLLQAFLKVDDSNIEERYRFFYDFIAPKIELYQVKVGDVMTIRAYTRAGYLKAVNTKVYGTFNFRGLERSDLAAAANLMDIVTFRDLYGLMSETRRAELETIREAVGAVEVDRQNAEDTLFGAAEVPVVVEAQAEGGFDELRGVDLGGMREALANNQTFDAGLIAQGVALNAAVVLDDPDRLEATRASLQTALDQAGLEMRVVDWHTASGIVGQFIIVIRLVLYVAITIIFLVALVIINNTMVMATLERTTEIGTLRAMGAQRSTVMTMFLFETVVLGLLAGTSGALGGALFVTWLGAVGIPAGSQDTLIFLFGGPRMYPSFGAANLALGLVSILVVSLVSTLYPARLATRIPPVVAMQAKE